MNLVRNALKFTDIEGKVTIRVCHADGLLVVNVEDTGAGIASEDFPKLFTRFGKLQRTAQINSEGIGLGLTMVKQIVESGGGAVGVDSPGVNQGSLFSFSMQMENQEPIVCKDPNNPTASAIDYKSAVSRDPLEMMQEAADETYNAQ